MTNEVTNTSSLSDTSEHKFSELEALIQIAFPGEKPSRRTVKVTVCKSHRISDYWDGGSRDYASLLLRLSSGKVVCRGVDEGDFLHQTMNNPYNALIGDLFLHPGDFLVEHVLFCGKDIGYHIYVSETKSLADALEFYKHNSKETAK
jgi:hypothetical protein